MAINDVIDTFAVGFGHSKSTEHLRIEVVGNGLGVFFVQRTLSFRPDNRKVLDRNPLDFLERLVFRVQLCVIRHL